MRVAVAGEVLWDITEKSQFLGGAPLNFAFHLHELGHEPLLISAVGDDELGSTALRAIEARGLYSKFIPRAAGHPTGTVTVKLGSHGVPEYVIHRPAAYDFPFLTAELEHEFFGYAPQWIYFGTLQQTAPQPRQFTQGLLEKLPAARRFYDLNLRNESYSPALVEQLLRQSDVVKLNEEEALLVADFLHLPKHSMERFCSQLRRMFSLQAVCVTRGAHGCSLLLKDIFADVPGYRVTVADTIGAGDAFSAALLHGIDAGWAPGRVAEFANRLGALVACLPGGAPQWSLKQLDALARP
jgi:fructokinase